MSVRCALKTLLYALCLATGAAANAADITGNVSFAGPLPQRPKTAVTIDQYMCGKEKEARGPGGLSARRGRERGGVDRESAGRRSLARRADRRSKWTRRAACSCRGSRRAGRWHGRFPEQRPAAAQHPGLAQGRRRSTARSRKDAPSRSHSRKPEIVRVDLRPALLDGELGGGGRRIRTTP